ncbi:hypothetical protein ASPVEDRAFT_42182 [Aspergillus versicolor CBS 583.65]|uniref:Uncharacterized protein n=1 Tax=Aspergillus versicolor CBS 583.65 TaxID=1036611 RepID=A0A1L9PML2_ASPVE|nr:uncharacterized protein ASPVEDRAFT_42182 [Aspergillus versicolor CBS 583.65]OJJ02676.1 hypothetical protein ASPVEDRAFT_42182 [Aspergillus versicolor CBS 583.65]
MTIAFQRKESGGKRKKGMQTQGSERMTAKERKESTECRNGDRQRRERATGDGGVRVSWTGRVEESPESRFEKRRRRSGEQRGIGGCARPLAA